jgi:hypothetical protein
MAAEKQGISADAQLKHIIAYSVLRQTGWRKHGKRVL